MGKMTSLFYTPLKLREVTFLCDSFFLNDVC